MNVSAQCKFCHKPLTLVIDDAYAEMGDPYKLVLLASCNRCGDYMISRGMIFKRIHKNAMRLFAGSVPKTEVPKIREVIGGLIKSYMRLIADQKRVTMPDWDEAIVDGIVEKPGNYHDVLNRIPAMFQQPTLV